MFKNKIHFIILIIIFNSSGTEYNKKQCIAQEFPFAKLPELIQQNILLLGIFSPLENKSPEEIVNSYKSYVCLKRVNKFFYNYLTEIVEPVAELNRYEHWLLTQLTQQSIDYLNEYIFISVRNGDFKDKESNLITLTELLIKLKIFDPDLIGDKGSNLLMFASINKLYNLVSLLLNYKIYDINEKNEKGHTALMHASYNGYIDIVKSLLRNKADVNQKDIEERSALMYATLGDKIHIVSLLLERGAEMDEKDSFGNNALMVACLKGHTDVVRLLLEKKADFKLKNKDNENALILAKNPEIQDLLIAAGALENL